MGLFTRVTYQDDAMEGRVHDRKQEGGSEEGIASGQFKINVPSTVGEQYPKYVFGIDNEKYLKYWSTFYDESNKYISFQMKYAIQLEGIGLACAGVDWYPQYRIETSLDLIEWDYSSTITVQRKPGNVHLYFPLSNGKRCRFLKITPLGSIQNTNFALYGVDFFGRIINPNNTCKQTYNNNNIVYVLILIIVR